MEIVLYMDSAAPVEHSRACVRRGMSPFSYPSPLTRAHWHAAAGGSDAGCMMFDVVDV